MSDCVFCGDYVGETAGDGGVKGRTIGNKDICLQCLAELKYLLNEVAAKAPSQREKVIAADEEDEEALVDEQPIEDDSEDGNPLSSTAKI